MAEIIRIAVESAINETEMFIRKFGYVPIERQNWSPTPTAKSAIRVASHVAFQSARFSRMIETKSMPNPVNVDEMATCMA
jgi:hypothetical protein